MLEALQTVLTVSACAALGLACVVRMSGPGELLAGTVGHAWQWWLIYRPTWIPAKASGDCAFCTCFWAAGVPLAAVVAVWLLSGWAVLLAPLVALFTAFLFERLLAR